MSSLTNCSSNHILLYFSVLIPFDLWTNFKQARALPQGHHLVMVPCAVSTKEGKYIVITHHSVCK